LWVWLFGLFVFGWLFVGDACVCLCGWVFLCGGDLFGVFFLLEGGAGLVRGPKCFGLRAVGFVDGWARGA
jgi:hypothetical protein